VADGVRRRVCLAAGADLAVDVRDVASHGAQAEHEFAGYFEIGTAGGDQAQDLDFASCEVVWIGGLLTALLFTDSRGVDWPHRPHA